jgi:hypothetical protein
MHALQGLPRAAAARQRPLRNGCGLLGHELFSQRELRKMLR